MPGAPAVHANGALPRVHVSVVHMLVHAALQSPDHPALEFDDTTLNYREYLRCVAGFAAELHARGAAGGRVALVIGNSPDSAVALFAVHAAGAQAVPLNPHYSARELGQILADAEPCLVVHDAAAAERLAAPLAELDLAAIDLGSSGTALARWRGDPDATLHETLPEPDGLATLQYTGGTTGLPKGVNVSHGQLAINISQREALLPTRSEAERVLCVMPMFHCYAVAMALHLAAYCHGTLVILPRYRPDAVLRALSERRITLFPGSPTIYTGLMQHAEFAATDFSALRLCYSGAERLPEETLRAWETATGCMTLEGFGQSEAGPVLAFNPEHGVRKSLSVGVPVPLTEIGIVAVDDPARELPPGEAGEIRVRGPQIMCGYRNRPDEDAVTLRDGWLHTGDIGRLDADGYLYIVGRKKEMVIVGGNNVYPREIEELLCAHPAITEAAAVGVPDAYRGEQLLAFVALSDGTTANVGTLLDYCAENLVRYKVPARLEVVDALPRTAVGKIDKQALQARGAMVEAGA